MAKMNQRIKKLWVEALRSGEYKQGTSRLRSGDDAFCCLGVLCNIHAQEHPEFAALQTSKRYYGKRDSHPPVVVSEWAGMEYRDEKTLASMNDSGEDFLTIADYIKKNL